MVGSLEGKTIFQTHKAGEWSASTHESASIRTRSHSYGLVIFNAGTVGLSGTVDVKVQESSDNGVADTWADVTGAAFTQVVTGRDDSAYIGHLNLNAREAYIRVVVDVGTAACDLGVTVLMSPDDTVHDTDLEFSV